jgi:hypothetical protein
MLKTYQYHLNLLVLAETHYDNYDFPTSLSICHKHLFPLPPHTAENLFNIVVIHLVLGSCAKQSRS